MARSELVASPYPSLVVSVHEHGRSIRTAAFTVDANPRVTLGSSPDCSVIIGGLPLVHAEIQLSQNGATIIDHSGGGTRHRGQSISRETLPAGRMVRFSLGRAGVEVSVESRLRETPPSRLPFPAHVVDQRCIVDVVPVAAAQQVREPNTLGDIVRPGRDSVLRTETPPRQEEVPIIRGVGGRARITLTAASRRSEFWLPNEQMAIIGRSSKASVKIPPQFEAVSSEHARLRWENGWLVLQDLDSSNGTSIDGRSIHRVVLRPSKSHRVVLANGVVLLDVEIEEPSVPRPGAPKREHQAAGALLPTARLRAVVQGNPKRVGSASHDRYQRYSVVYRAGGTVADAQEAGATLADIKWDIAHGFVAIGGATEQDHDRSQQEKLQEELRHIEQRRQALELREQVSETELQARQRERLENEQSREQALLERRRLDEAWGQLEEERRKIDDERRRLQDQRVPDDFASEPATDPSLPSGADSSVKPAWLDAVPAVLHAVLVHLATHGRLSEDDATSMLGGARQFRRFSREIDALQGRLPFTVRIETSSGVKCYVVVQH